jgi:hypothetical protein
MQPQAYAFSIDFLEGLEVRMTTVRIESVQIPVGSCDGDSWPVRHNKWHIDFPIVDPAQIGIGYIVEPSPFVFAPTAFALHDHHYSSNNVPDATRAEVIYKFSARTVVRDLAVIQHTNGITEIEGFMSDTLGPWPGTTSIGIAKSRLVTPATGITPTGGGMFVEGARDIFEFPNPIAKLYLRIVIRKTPLANGYATYKIYPRNDQHDPLTVASANNLFTPNGLITVP